MNARRQPRLTRVGVIGCGWVAGEGHLPALARMPEAEVVALADRDPARLEALGRRFGVSGRHLDHSALIEDPHVDVIAVCVPVTAHAEVAGAAIEAGKHVLLEKPPALGLDEWDRLAKAVESAGVAFMVGLNMRWHASFQAARKLVRSGGLGPLRGLWSVLANNLLDRPDPPPWRSERRLGGGALLEMGVHHLDLWRYLTGEEIAEVFAFTEGDDASLTVSARMQSGLPVSGLFSQCSAQLNEVGLLGGHGQLKATPHAPPQALSLADKPWMARARMAGLRAAISPSHALRIRREGGFYVSSFVGEWRHFLAAVRDGSPVEIGVESGRRLLQAVLATAASSSQRRPIACADAPATLTPHPAAPGSQPE